MLNETVVPVLVSVRLMVYNNEAYVEHAINGALMQKTNFRFEIIIGDDFSSDGTKEILEKYEQRFPEIIKVLKRPRGGEYYLYRKNKNQIANFKNIIDNCNGEYIALLDGDDYWTDETKLQTQFELLKYNKHVALVFHKVSLLKGKRFENFFIPNNLLNTNFKFEEFLGFNNFIATSSVFFKKPINYQFPDYILKLPFADIAFYKYISLSGDLYCIDKEMGVYRIHEGGIWSGLRNREVMSKYIDFYIGLYPHLTLTEQKVLGSKLLSLNKIYLSQNYCNVNFFLLLKMIKAQMKVSRLSNFFNKN